MAHLRVPLVVVVSDHAIERLRLRVGRVRRWSRHQCERWIVDAVNTSVFTISRKNGEIYFVASLFGRSLYLAILPSPDGAAGLVRTVLPHVFAQRNLLHSVRRGAGRGA